MKKSMFFLTIILFYSLILFSYENGTVKKMGEFFDKILSLYNEPKISELELKSKEVFRLKYCERYCEKHFFIRIEKDNGKHTLIVKGAPFYFYDSDQKTLLLKDFEAEINEKVWSNIKKKIDDSGFWKKEEIIKIDSKEKQIMGLPGASYLLEGYKNNLYHYIYRTDANKDSKVNELYNYFRKIAIEEYNNPNIKIITETPYLKNMLDLQKESYGSNHAENINSSAVDDLNDACILPFKQICDAEFDLSKRVPDGLSIPMINKNEKMKDTAKKCIEKTKNDYFKLLNEMRLSPVACEEKDFLFRILIMMPNSLEIIFINTSIQMYEEEKSFYLRISYPFPSPHSSKYDCYKKKDSDFLIYKMTTNEKDNIIKNVKSTQIFKKEWIYYFIDEKYLISSATKRKEKPHAFVLEAVFNGKYHSAYSEFIFADEDDALIFKDESDSNLTFLARELFGFFYKKILTGDVRYFEFDKKWEDLKPFEGCKTKDDNKQEMKSEKVSN